MTTSAPPGWYDDPENSDAQRYWDGQNWTPHRERKNTDPTTPHPAPAAGPPLSPAAGRTPSDQLGAYVEKVRPHVAKGRQLWSGLSRRRKVISAVAVCGAVLLIFTGLSHEFSHNRPGVGPGISGHSPAYQEGYDIASHEIVQESLMANPDDVQGACVTAYDTYNGSGSNTDKGQYIAGCVDWVNTHAKPSPPTVIHGREGY